MKRIYALLLTTVTLTSLVTGCSMKIRMHNLPKTTGESKVLATEQDTTVNDSNTGTETSATETEMTSSSLTGTVKIGNTVFNWDVDSEIRKNQFVTINGDTFTIPSKIQDWLDAGYTFNEDCGVINDDGSYCMIAANDLKGCTVEKDGLSIILTLYNFSDTEIPCDEATVGDFFVDENAAGVENAVIELPEGIQLGKSTKEEIIDVYGEPFSIDTESLPDEEFLVFSSKSDIMRKVSLGVSKDTGKLTTIMLVSTNNP